jgi:flagellar biosynthesis/type III secretory pathway protein FliH
MTLPSVTGERILAAEREAHARGFAEGERQGSEAAVAQAHALSRRLTHAISDVETLRSETMRRTEREMVRLTIAMAHRILGNAIDADPERLVALAQAAIDRAGKTTDATVHLNPADHELLAAADLVTAGDGAAGRRPDRLRGVTLVADSAVPRGGCVIRSPLGLINAGISTQIFEMSRLLLGEEPTSPAGATEETSSR